VRRVQPNLLTQRKKETGQTNFHFSLLLLLLLLLLQPADTDKSGHQPNRIK
jgi:hypothetical protein